MREPREAIRQYILTEFLPGESPANLADDTPLRTTGILDSNTTLKLVDYIEREFGIEVEARDLKEDNIGTINALVAFIERCVAAK